ncbi:MAG: hypothetical protein IKB02_06135 [Clostridia bacterium]|nr:hypothetical protein [Clostridia bacterium]
MNSAKKCEKENKPVSPEKIFLRSFIFTVLSALLGIAALSMSTWAWFVGSVSSNTSSIVATDCSIEITVTKLPSTIETVSNDDGSASATSQSNTYECTLEAGATYLVNLKPSGSATTCYCRLKIGNNEYFTEQIRVFAGNVFTFKLTAEADTDLTIVQGWGTASVREDQRTFESGENKLYKIRTDMSVELIETTEESTTKAEETTTQPAETNQNPQIPEAVVETETTVETDAPASDETEPSGSEDTTEPSDSDETQPPESSETKTEEVTSEPVTDDELDS